MPLILIIVLIGIFAPEVEIPESTTKQESPKVNPDSLAIERLKIEISGIKDFDGSIYRDNLSSIKMELFLFEQWAKIIQENRSSSNEKAVDLAYQLNEYVSKIQEKEFPLLRKAWVKLSADQLWEHDIYMTSEGRIVNLTGAIFATNKNIKATQETISEMVISLRFSEVRYRWYKGADEFTYYKLNPKNDGDI